MTGRTIRGALALLVTALVLAGGCGQSTPTPARTSPSQPSPSQACPGSPLTCEQLIALGFSYPYRREPGSYLFVNGAAYPYGRVTDDLVGDSEVRVGQSRLAVGRLLSELRVPPPGRLIPVIAYGSNANVEALTRKFVTSGFAGDAVVPVMKARLRDHDVAWLPALVFNGAMPATIVRSPGTTVEVWINWLDPRALRFMNRTEAVGQLYSYGALRGARLSAPGPRVARPFVYEGCLGPLRIEGRIQAIAAIRASGRTFDAVTSAVAMDRISPSLGWRGSVLELLLANVESPAQRAVRSRALAKLAAPVPDRSYTPELPCR